MDEEELKLEAEFHLKNDPVFGYWDVVAFAEHNRVYSRTAFNALLDAGGEPEDSAYEAL